MFNFVETFTASNISATAAAFVVRGGNYGMTVNATFGGGTVKLQKLSIDASTYVDVLSFTAAGHQNANLPSGSYRFAVTTATAVYIDLTATVTAQ